MTSLNVNQRNINNNVSNTNNGKNVATEIIERYNSVTKHSYNQNDFKELIEAAANCNEDQSIELAKIIKRAGNKIALSCVLEKYGKKLLKYNYKAQSFYRTLFEETKCYGSSNLLMEQFFLKNDIKPRNYDWARNYEGLKRPRTTAENKIINKIFRDDHKYYDDKIQSKDRAYLSVDDVHEIILHNILPVKNREFKENLHRQNERIYNERTSQPDVSVNTKDGKKLDRRSSISLQQSNTLIISDESVMSGWELKEDKGSNTDNRIHNNHPNDDGIPNNRHKRSRTNSLQLQQSMTSEFHISNYGTRVSVEEMKSEVEPDRTESVTDPINEMANHVHKMEMKAIEYGNDPSRLTQKDRKEILAMIQDTIPLYNNLPGMHFGDRYTYSRMIEDTFEFLDSNPDRILHELETYIFIADRHIRRLNWNRVPKFAG